MRTSNINFYTFANTSNSKNKGFLLQTAPCNNYWNKSCNDSFEKKLSFGNITPEKYTFDTFKTSKNAISELLNTKELNADEEAQLLAHHNGMYRLISKGKKDEELYNTFFNVTNRLIEKEDGKSPAADGIIKSVFRLVKESSESKGRGKCNEFTDMLDLVNPELIKKFNSHVSEGYELTLPENKKAFQEIAAQIDAAIIEYKEQGNSLLETAMASYESTERDKACRQLVKGRHFALIQEYLNNLPETLSAEERLNVFELGLSFAKLKKEIGVEQIITSIRDGYMCEEGKRIFNGAIKVCK